MLAPCLKIASDSRYSTPGSSRVATRSPSTSPSGMRRKIAVSPLRPGRSAGATSPQVGRAAMRLGGVWPPRRTTLARHAASSLADRGRPSARKAARKDALGRINDSDGADSRAGVVEDRRGHARLAEHGLVALRRDSLVSYRHDLLAQGRLIERLLRQARGRLRKEVVDHLWGRERQDCLSQRARMQRQLKADIQDAECGVRTEHVVDDDDTRSMHDPDPDTRVGPSGEPVGAWDRARPQLGEVEA